MRFIRRLAIVLAVVVALYAFVDSLVANVAEKRIASILKQELSLEQAPDVHVSGFPILLRAMLYGDMSEVSFDARDVTIGGLKLRRASARLEDLHAPDLLNARKLQVTVGRGSATAEVSDAALNAYIKRKGVNVTVSTREGTAVVRTTRRILFRTRAVVARGPIKIDGRQIVFEPRSVTVDGVNVSGFLRTEATRFARFAVTIPALPGGARVERVELHRGFTTLHAALAGQTLRFG